MWWMNGIEVDNPPSPPPDFNGASIEVLLCLLDSGLIIRTFEYRGCFSDMPVFLDEKDAIFLHVSTSCMIYRSPNL
jgi:hypothetical protein